MVGEPLKGEQKRRLHHTGTGDEYRSFPIDLSLNQKLLFIRLRKAGRLPGSRLVLVNVTRREMLCKTKCGNAGGNGEAALKTGFPSQATAEPEGQVRPEAYTVLQAVSVGTSQKQIQELKAQ